MNRNFILNINIEMIATDEQGRTNYGQGLRVSESIRIAADSFLEMASVLGRFHELSESIKEGNKN